MSRSTPKELHFKRLRSIHRRMSFVAFKRLRRRLGWKHEYYGGQAHITPSRITVTFLLDLAPRNHNGTDVIRPLGIEDAKALQDPFRAAFALAPEYADYPEDRFRQTADKYIQGFFGSVRGEWSRVSVVAEVGGRIVGAALVKHQRPYPLLDCLFVHPYHARQGLATAMVSHAVNALVKSGESRLLSYVLLANGPSLDWHYHFGFREIPDLWVASARSGFYHSELNQDGQREHLPEEDLAELGRLTDYWGAEVKRLEEVEKRDFWAAHPHFEGW
jgi:ribosomal protein S18 acetylase RimI-like enzyme